MQNIRTSLIPALPENAIVAVALSGGADSLYTLVNLHDAGIRVMGIHGLFANALPSFCNPPAQEQAKSVQKGLAAVCSRLGVPFFTVDCTKEFTDQVVAPFITSYAQGKTPNPCALCNASIKFGILLDHALQLGATHIATGHYVRLQKDQGRTMLLQGADPVKDQSYFLSLVPMERLLYACFPLGDICKTEVLARLAELGFTPPQKKESQDVCFVPDDDYRNFLPQMAGHYGIALSGEGPILLEDGQKLGQHKGLWQYTEGQRKGLNIPWKERLHVIAKEHEKNILRLGPKESMAIGGCFCREVNILVPAEEWPHTVLVKTRYKEPPRQASVTFKNSGADLEMHIHFLQPEALMAPGQIAAIYVPEPDMYETDGRPVLKLVAGGVMAGSLPLTQ